MEFYTCHAEGCDAIVGPLDTDPFPGYRLVNFEAEGWVTVGDLAMCPKHSGRDEEIRQLPLFDA